MPSTALIPTYARSPIAFERGAGAYLYSTDGRRYLDFAAGIAVDILGHAHPHLVTALIDQARLLWHVSNLYEIPEQTRYAERLVAACFADAAFFCNTGAEAVEGALKMARRCQSATGRYRTITVEGAFHGRTLATISAAGNPKYLEGFGPPVDGFDHVAFGNLNELRGAIGAETGAILVETVQGEGGIRPLPAEYLRGLRAAADEFDLILIFDEVQCGFGRTGKLFAYEHSGVAPDIMAVAKGIAGGFPCGGILATRRVADAMAPGTHATTFGGNPLAMAVANATLDVLLGSGFLDNVAHAGRTLAAALADLAERFPGVVLETRGLGLMLGLRLAESVTNISFAGKAMERGLLLVPAGQNVVRFVPPLIIGEAEIAEATEILGQVCADFSGDSSGDSSNG